jgi:hypothetical protein
MTNTRKIVFPVFRKAGVSYRTTKTISVNTWQRNAVYGLVEVPAGAKLYIKKLVFNMHSGIPLQGKFDFYDPELAGIQAKNGRLTVDIGGEGNMEAINAAELEEILIED